MSRVSDVRVAETRPVALAVIRGEAKQSDLPVVIPAACGEVWTYAREAGLESPGRHVAVYLDDRITFECGVEVGAPFEGSDRVVPSTTPGGTTASVTLTGPYSGLSDAHRTIVEWSRASGRGLAGPSWEVYGHWAEDPEQLRTEVHYLLR